MRLRFKATPVLQEYHGAGLDLLPGQEAEISTERAARLIADFPKNFEPVTIALEEPPKDKMIRRDGRVKVK